MKNSKWNAFQNRLVDRRSVKKKDKEGSKNLKNPVVIICTALFLILMISSVAGRIKENKTVNELSETVETFKMDTLDGNVYRGTVKILFSNRSDEQTGVDGFGDSMDQKPYENSGNKTNILTKEREK